MIKMLLVSSEGYPFVKSDTDTGFAYSLSKELSEKNMDVRVIVPKYGKIDSKLKKKMKWKKSITVPVAWRNQYCDIEELVYEGVTFYFISNEHYFNRQQESGYDDDAERFAFFCRAVLESLISIDFKPDILHCYEWQTSLVSVFLHADYKKDDFYKDMKTILTVSNIERQGIFPKEILADVLGLGEEYFTIDTLEFYGQVNLLKGGLMLSDAIAMGSKSSSEEVIKPGLGEKLDGVFLKRKDNLYGILNGLDNEIYNPATDANIFTTYQRSLKKKNENKSKLQEMIGLPVNKDVPLVAVISPLTVTKGLDMIADGLEEMLKMDIQMVVLGHGAKSYEGQLQNVAKNYSDKFNVNLSPSQELTHKVFAASDMLLSPCLFECCGHQQMIALRYGTIPIVSDIGCLKDIVENYSPETGEGNGIVFSTYKFENMLETLKSSIDLYHDKDSWNQLFKNAMKSTFSWKESARQYSDLYRSVLRDNDYILSSAS